MKSKLIAIACVCVLMLSACGSPSVNAPVDTTAAAQTTVLSSETTTAAETEAAADETAADETEAPLSETEAAETEASAFVPRINEEFAKGLTLASERGDAVIELVDDDTAADKRAMKISGRVDAWNGADYNCELFRGNTVEVKGSFRSTDPQVKVTVQLSVHGNVTYNTFINVDTNDQSYSQGNGKYDIPANAEQILIYIESDGTGDIYVDDFSVNVVGDYQRIDKVPGMEFADISEYPSMRELYENDFRIGTCISVKMVTDEDYSRLIAAQYSSVTCENDMKPEGLLDKVETLSDIEKYREAPALKFEQIRPELDFARDNGMTVRGHTLLWHSQTPEWIFYKDYDTSGELADRELMLKRLENYIKGVMEWTDENYPGLISAWDVVNEAIDDGGGIRKSNWYKTIGDDYIERAFEFARKYAPEGAKLFYNDYNSYQPGKQADIIKALTPIAEAGNIDGVGMQSHISTDTSITLFMMALKKYTETLGVEVQITELDIGTQNTDEGELKQGDFVSRFMTELLRLKHEGVPITSVTYWGVSDSLSWRAKDHPLLFRDDLSNKPAFDAMIAAAENSGG